MPFCLFRWLRYSCWLLLGIISLASAFFIILYSLELNKDQATSWVVSMMLSILQDIFICQPVKVCDEWSNHHSWRKQEKPRLSVFTISK